MSGMTAAPQDGATRVYMIQSVHSVSANRTAMLGTTHVNQSEVRHRSDEWPSISGEGQCEAPELPLEGDNSHDSETLEDHRQRRLSAGHPTIEQADSGHDEEHKTSEDDLIL